MTVVRRDVAQDGISRAVETTVTLQRGRGKLKDKRYLTADDMSAIGAFFVAGKHGQSLFDAVIEPIETYWSARPKAEGTPGPLSEPWYRSEILRQIEWVRKIVAPRDSPEATDAARLAYWIVAAMTLGRLIEEADWRCGHGDTIRTGRKVRLGGRRGGQTTGQARGEAASPRDKRIAEAAEKYRARYPDVISHPTRAMVLHLSQTLRRPSNTIRGRLAKLKIR